MWVYWLMFLLPAVAVLAPQSLARREQIIVWWLTAIFFSLIIGLRYEVGGDWMHYLDHLGVADSSSLAETLSSGDYGYFGLNWLVAQLGGGIFLVNWVCAAIVMAGVVTFSRAQPRPWLALLVAVPYLLIVVAMGYTRQSVALGLVLIGLVALSQQRLKAFVAWVLMGALFHKSALLLIPIAALVSSRQKIWNALWIAITAALAVYLMHGKSSEALWNSYVVADYQSEGGAIRVAMNAIPALLVLIFRRRLIPDPTELKLWTWMALLSLACLPLVVISSTAVDRVALYFIPIQLYVFARLDRLAVRRDHRALIVIGVVGYYGVIEFVWLNFASHAMYWVPYHFMPL